MTTILSAGVCRESILSNVDLIWAWASEPDICRGLHSMSCGCYVSAWICLISTCYFTRACFPECCDGRCDCCFEEVGSYGFTQITPPQSYHLLEILNHKNQSEFSIILKPVGEQTPLKWVCRQHKIYLIHSWCIFLRADISSVDLMHRSSQMRYQRPENSRGEKSKCCQLHDHWSYFHHRIKENLFSSAKCFAFTFLHQDIADKRIHYQGLTQTRHQRSHQIHF